MSENRIVGSLWWALALSAASGCATPGEPSLEGYVTAEDEALLGRGAQPSPGLFDGEDVLTLPVDNACDFGDGVTEFIPVLEVMDVDETGYTLQYREPKNLDEIIGGTTCERTGRSTARCGTGEPVVIDLDFAGMDAVATLSFEPSRNPVLWLSSNVFYEYAVGAEWTCEGPDCERAASEVFGLVGGFPCNEPDTVQRFHRRS